MHRKYRENPDAITHELLLLTIILQIEKANAAMNNWLSDWGQYSKPVEARDSLDKINGEHASAIKMAWV